jgi:transposase InsO family protein
MGVDVKMYVKNCLTCAKRKAYGSKKAPLKPLQPVQRVWEMIAMDIVGPITESRNGFKYILVLSDYATRYVMTFPMADQTAQSVAKNLVQGVISKYGAPDHILTDQGSNFLSQLVQDICRLFNVHQMNTTAYHPQTDGLVERFNRTLCDMLACYVHDEPELWDIYLPFVTLAYNTSNQTSLNETPFFLFYGREPNLPTDEVKSIRYRAVENEGEKYRQEWQIALNLARTNLSKAQEKQKHNYDRGSKISSYRVGQHVLINSTVSTGKFSNRWDGPYRIVRIVSDVNIEVIDTEKEWKFQGRTTPFIVHVNRMKLINFNPTTNQLQNAIVPETNDDKLVTTNKRGRPRKLADTKDTLARKLPGKRRGRPPKASKQATLVGPHPHGNEDQRKRRGRPPKDPMARNTTIKPLNPLPLETPPPTVPNETISNSVVQNNSPRYNLRTAIKRVNRY